MHPYPSTIPLAEIKLLATAIRAGTLKDDPACVLQAAWTVAGYGLSVTVGQHDHETGFGAHAEPDVDEALAELDRWTQLENGVSADGDDQRPPELAPAILLRVALWLLLRLAR
jgi:hypothetical protein